MKKINFFLISILLVINLNAQKNQIFTEYFNNNDNSWYLGENNDWSFKIEDGNYKINRKIADGKTTYWAKAINIDQTRDFSIETNLLHTGGVENHAYGITWGFKDIDNNFAFLISANGYYVIEKKENNKSAYYSVWTKSSSIKQNSYNTLKIEKTGNNYIFYINDEYQMQVPFESFFDQKVGFIVSDNQTFNVDDLIIYQENQKSQADNALKTLVFSENFNNNKNSWYEADSNKFSCKIQDGKYKINRKAIDNLGNNWTKAIFIDQAKDFSIKTSIFHSGGAENYGYSFVWGYKDIDNNFNFYLAADGHYKIIKREGGKSTAYSEWTMSSSIKTGKSTNELRIDKTRNYISFYINDAFISQQPFENFFGQRIGFKIEGTQSIEIDYLNIYVQDPDIPSNPVIGVNISGLMYNLLNDDFSSNSNDWYEVDNDKAKLSYDAGTYKFENKNINDSYISYISLEIKQVSDFIIEATIEKTEGNNSSPFGIIWGADDVSSEFIFEITGDGKYNVNKYSDEGDEALIENTQSSFINTYNNCNKLTICKENDKLKFYVNGQYLNSIFFQPFFGDNLGFIVYGITTVKIHDLKVWQTSPKRQVTK